MAADSTPKIRRTAQNTQYTYNLGRRIHDVKTYPVLSPQGATILIYAHENGLTLIWRGGQRLKALKKEATSDQVSRDKMNGAGRDDTVMVIDSDSDEPLKAAAPKPFVDKPEFEDVDSEDASLPDIIQTLDLSLGAAVRHIAVLPIPRSAADDAAWGGAEALKNKMVFAVTTITLDVNVITLPLTPPSHESKARSELQFDLLAGAAGKGLWGETLVSLGGQVQHSDAAAITLAKQPQPSRAAGERPGSNQTVRVIVAAHSRQATGVLRLWDVTVGQKRPASERALEPFQTDFLPSPLTSISFNPTHTTQLLAVASPHAVRVYDYSLSSIPPDESDGPLPSQGSWLLSLYPPFIRGVGLSIARKPIIAAEWVSHGRAVLALLADGQWGIWDIDGSGPSTSGSSSTGSLFGKATSAVRGAALTTFSASGQLEGTSPLRNPGAQKSTGDLVPMTPHTRRDAALSFAGGPERLAAIRGGIDVVQLPIRMASGSSEESVVLWMGGADHVVAVIPVLSRFWDAQVRRGAGGGVNLFSGAQPMRMLRLTDLSAGLLGERCSGVGAIPCPQKQQQHSSNSNSGARSGNGGGHHESLPIDVLVRGESRLVVVREADDALAPSALTSKLLSVRKRLLGPVPQDVAPPAAIVAHPRPNAAAAAVPTAPANLAQTVTAKGGSLRARASLFGKRAPLPGVEDAARTPAGQRTRSFSPSMYDDEPTLTQSMMAIRFRGADAGMGFADQLDDAADAEDDEEAANERNVEEEILDIMEIDRALEEMEGEREQGTKHVFFETAS